MKNKVIFHVILFGLVGVCNLTFGMDAPKDDSSSTSVTSYEGTTGSETPKKDSKTPPMGTPPSSGSGSRSPSKKEKPINLADLTAALTELGQSPRNLKQPDSTSGSRPNTPSPKMPATLLFSNEDYSDKILYNLLHISGTIPTDIKNVLLGDITQITCVNKTPDNHVYKIVISTLLDKSEVFIRSEEPFDAATFPAIMPFYITATNPAESTARTFIINELHVTLPEPVEGTPKKSLKQPETPQHTTINLDSSVPKTPYSYFTPAAVGLAALIAAIVALYQFDYLPDNMTALIRSLLPAYFTQT